MVAQKSEEQQLKPGMVVEIEVTAEGSRGDGIGHIWGYTVFVKGAAVGVKTQVQIENVRERNAWGDPVVVGAEERRGKGGGGKTEEVGFTRVYIPKKGELFGIVTQRLGFKRMYVLCEDGKTRITRTPGRKRRLWIREGDTIIVEPWSVQGDEKADIVHKYRKAEVEWLSKNNYLKNLEGLE